MSEKNKDRWIKNSEFDIPFFVDSTNPPSHNCGSCEHRVKDGSGYTCLLVKQKINLQTGTCLLWEHGEEKYTLADANRKSRSTPETAGYVEEDIPINCSTCDHYKNDYCHLWEGKVKDEQCCDVWEHTKEDKKPYTTWSEFKANKLDKIQ
jgi:hypothetical protein